jgi:hypothetical protein
MHTLKVIAAGICLLVLFLLVGRLLGGSNAAIGRATYYFIAAWLVAAVINLAIGVVSAGYSVVQELPIFLIVFGVPALVALVVKGIATGAFF